MGITAIKRDWGDCVSIVRIVSTDNLAAVGAGGYLTAQADNIAAINNGAFEWLISDFVLVYASDGWGLFSIASDFTSLTAFAINGGLSSVLANGDIFVGSAGNVATARALSGDATLSNTGVMTIANNAITTAKILNANVTLAKLAAGITPSHIVKFAGQHTTVGGGAAEVITVTGALNTDLAFVQMVDNGTNNTTVVSAVVTADTLTVTFSADPGADAIINYQLLRAAA